jgi:hypothetical protein
MPPRPAAMKAGQALAAKSGQNGASSAAGPGA